MYNSELVLSGITDRIFLTASVMLRQWFVFPFLKMSLRILCLYLNFKLAAAEQNLLIPAEFRVSLYCP